MATLTTVGYGDYYATTVQEQLVIMAIELVGIGFFGYLIGRLNTLLRLVDLQDEVYTFRKEGLEKFLIQLDRAAKNRSLNSTYVEHIQDFFSIYWKANNHTLLDDQFFEQLPHTIQNDLIDYLFGHIILRFQYFFEGTSIGFQRDIAKNLKFMIYEKFPKKNHSLFQPDNERSPQILRKGEIPNHVSFILQGEVAYGNADGKYQFFTIGPGSFFGEEYLLFYDACSYSIFHQHMEKVYVLQIDAARFMEVCSFHPLSEQLLKKRALERRAQFRRKKMEWMSQFRNVMQSKMQAMQANIMTITRESPRESDQCLPVQKESSMSLPSRKDTKFCYLGMESMISRECQKEDTPILMENMRQHLNSDSFYETMHYNSEDEKDQGDYEFEQGEMLQDKAMRRGLLNRKLNTLKKLSLSMLHKLNDPSSLHRSEMAFQEENLGLQEFKEVAKFISEDSVEREPLKAEYLSTLPATDIIRLQDESNQDNVPQSEGKGTKK